MATIFDFADIVNRSIEVTFCANQNGRIITYFEHAEIKRDIFLEGIVGEGKTVLEALNNYVQKIRGKTIVFDAMSSVSRREYQVPAGLELLNKLP